MAKADRRTTTNCCCLHVEGKNLDEKKKGFVGVYR